MAALAAIASSFAFPALSQAKWVQPSDQRIGPEMAFVAGASLTHVGSDLVYGQVENASGVRSVVAYRFAQGAASWAALGAPLGLGASDGASGVQLASSPASVYATWQQQDPNTSVLSVYAKRLDPGIVPEEWASLGGALNLDSTRNASSPSLAVLSGLPYVAFVQSTSSVRLLRTVRFDGTTWTSLAAPMNRSVVSDASKPKLVTFQNSLGVTWTETLGADRNAYATEVNQLTGVPAPLGGAINLPEGSARECDLIEAAGSPVAGCLVDVAGTIKFLVKRFDALSGEWLPVGGVLNAGAGDASDGSIAEIGGSLFAVHREPLGKVNRVMLSRFNDETAQWELLPEFVGSEPDTAPELKSILGLALVSVASGAGGGRVFQLAPSVSNFAIRAGADGAEGTAFVDTYGLPYSLAGVASSTSVPNHGTVVGTPPDVATVFTGLALATPYDAQLLATDPFGRTFIVGETGFVTDDLDASEDDDQPLVALTFHRRTARPPRIVGTSSDIGSGVSFVQVALESRRGSRCSWLTDGPFAPGGCATPRWHTASGTDAFSFPLKRKQSRRIMRSAYEVYARSIDAAGNVSEVQAYRCTRYRKSRAGSRTRRVSECSEWQ